MAENKRGRSSFLLPRPPVITAWASVAGKKESQGPLGHCFDKTSQDTFFGQKTWEQAEKADAGAGPELAAEKGRTSSEFDLDLVLSGDLLNQCIGSAFCRAQYGTCPTWGFTGPAPPWRRACCWPPWPWTAALQTGAAAHDLLPLCLLRAAVPLPPGLRRPANPHRPVDGDRLRLRAAGVPQRHGARYVRQQPSARLTDLGIQDANNMGAAMAPAALATIQAALSRTWAASPQTTTCIVTGDLGQHRQGAAPGAGPEGGH